MKRVVILVISFFIGNAMLLAQEVEINSAGHNHGFTLTKPGAFLANAFVWISIAVVVITLVLTLKYLFFPGEKDPNHIKNIVKDEGFRKNS